VVRPGARVLSQQRRIEAGQAGWVRRTPEQQQLLADARQDQYGSSESRGQDRADQEPEQRSEEREALAGARPTIAVRRRVNRRRRLRRYGGAIRVIGVVRPGMLVGGLAG